MAWLGGGASAGITGAEFRVSGMPPEWLTTTVPNSASNIVLGDPFNGVGVNQAFPTCQTAPIIILFTVNVMPTSSVSDLYLRVEPRNPPLNPNFACPLVTNCEFPGFAIVCTTGGQGIVNPTGALCTVTTTPASWSSVKALYDEP
jgi:hypothetical protein